MSSLVGLSNLGNTCFLNSAIQCLLNTPELNSFLDKATYKDRLTNTPDAAILSEYDELRKLVLSNSSGTMRPGKFVTAVHKVAKHKDKDIFTGFAQNDLPEFLLFVIDCFNTAIKRSVTITVDGTPKNDKDKLAVSCYTAIKRMYEKEYSEMLGIFFGIHTSIVNASTAERKLLSTSPEPFFILSLPIPINHRAPSIIDCFDLYTSEETLTGENQYVANEATGEKVDATKRILFWSLPKVLIIDLKRFIVSGNRMNKYTGNVIFSPSAPLDLSKYIVGYSPSQYKYELYGVCNHMGGLTGGHYTAYIKKPGGQWWHFNDAHVSQMREEDVCSPAAYCLFYRQIGTI
jgi:ubiquitin carboxyl-terminal hydrolase 8